MPSPIALQLYTLRDAAARDLYSLLKRVAQMGYLGVEYHSLCGKPAADVARIAGDLHLKPVSLHVSLPTRETIDQTAADAHALGCTRIVSGFGPREMATENATKSCVERMARACEIARSAGLSLAMHNHWWEFDRTFAGRTPFEIILSAAPELSIELDIYWCAKAGVDVTEIVKRWTGRIPLMHIKDGTLSDEPMHTPVGEGRVPIKPAIKAAKGLEWVIVELDNCSMDMFDAVSRSIKWLAGNALGRNRKQAK